MKRKMLSILKRKGNQWYLSQDGTDTGTGRQGSETAVIIILKDVKEYMLAVN